MDIVPLPADEAAVRRYVEDLWIPYHREREATVDGFALADGVDLVAEEVAHRLDRHATEGYRAWVAVDGSHEAAELADVEGEFVGFVTTDIYVRDADRGTGLARELVARAEARAGV